MGGPKVQRYVCGFLFSDDFTQVALIHKQKPAWQKNKYNGIGGKIEENETEDAAMSREFKEETGVLLTEHEWVHFCRYIGDRKDNPYEIYYYFASSDLVYNVDSITDETVHIFNINDLPDEIIFNLNWLIYLALDDTIKYPVVIRDINGN